MHKWFRGFSCVTRQVRVDLLRGRVAAVWATSKPEAWQEIERVERCVLLAEELLKTDALVSVLDDLENLVERLEQQRVNQVEITRLLDRVELLEK
jgi:hypothetical protein